MNPKAKVTQNTVFHNSLDDVSKANYLQTGAALVPIDAGSEVQLLEAPKVGGKTYYRAQLGNASGYLKHECVEIIGPTVSNTQDAEVFKSDGPKGVTNTSAVIRFAAPVWILSQPEVRKTPGGKEFDFVKVRFWSEDQFPKEGYVLVSDLSGI